jgi:hypothetical protein
MGNHASTRTTQLYDRRAEEVTLDEVDGYLFEIEPCAARKRRRGLFFSSGGAIVRAAETAQERG